MTDRLLYNVKETAEILCTSRWTISAMFKTGELTYIPWRGSRKAKRVERSAILACIAKMRAGNPEELLRQFDGRRAENKARRVQA